jgi:magnesium transporter
MVTTLFDKQSNGFEWIDVSNPTKEELSTLASKYQLHPNLVYDSLQPDHLPKYEMVGEIQFIILRVFDLHAKTDAETIQNLTRKIAIFVGPDFIITIHRVAFPFIQEIRDKFVAKTEAKTQYDIIPKIIRVVIQSYHDPLQKIIQDLDFYESRIFLKEKVPSLLRNLYYIKRKTSVVVRIFGLIKPILDSLENKLPSTVVTDLRDSLTAGKVSVEQNIENVNNLLNIYISLSSQRTNEVMRVLTIFSVFFMPLTFIAGIYGMNFDFMPELRLKLGYPAVMVVMVVVSIIIYIWFKRKGWL